MVEGGRPGGRERRRRGERDGVLNRVKEARREEGEGRVAGRLDFAAANQNCVEPKLRRIEVADRPLGIPLGHGSAASA